MATSGAEGTFRAHGTEEGGEAIRETLPPTEAHRRDCVRDGVLCYCGDDFAVRKGLSHPAFAIRDVSEKPSVALCVGVSVFQGSRSNGGDTLASSRVIRLFMSFSSKRSSNLMISAPSEHGVSSRQL